VSAFWLSNCFELLSVVKSTQDKEAREHARRRQQAGRRGSDASESERILDKIRTDLDYLLIEIYHGWIKELKKRLANMIVPAVIENQSLPGYIWYDCPHHNKVETGILIVSIIANNPEVSGVNGENQMLRLNSQLNNC
jgi:hypothetical protein